MSLRAPKEFIRASTDKSSTASSKVRAGIVRSKVSRCTAGDQEDALSVMRFAHQSERLVFATAMVALVMAILPGVASQDGSRRAVTCS